MLCAPCTYGNERGTGRGRQPPRRPRYHSPPHPGHILRESSWPRTGRSGLVGRKKTASQSTHRHPRVCVSRVQAPSHISRDADSIRERLRSGAKTVVVDTAGQLIELDDKTFASAGDEWTLRFTAGSQARIHLDSPLPATAHIVATDATTVEVTGQVHVWAYTRDSYCLRPMQGGSPQSCIHQSMRPLHCVGRRQRCCTRLRRSHGPS